MDEMLKTMYEAPGIGLAAVQIGVLKRIIVIDITKEEKKKSYFPYKSRSLLLNQKTLQFTRKAVFLYLVILLK